MKFITSGSRKLLAVAALGSAAAFVTACGSSSSAGSPPSTVTVTISPSSGTSPSPATPVPATPSSAPAGPAECTTAALHVMVGQSNGAAGTIYFNLDFTNASASSCFVQGYPGVSLVSAGSNSGSQIGADAKRDPVTPVHQIVLAAGQTAHAVLGVTDAGNFPSSTCHMVTAHFIKVFPPDQTVPAYAPFTTQTCASTSVPTMHITAISSGA
jgi:Protein of unknown function (DUF4232)